MDLRRNELNKKIRLDPLQPSLYSGDVATVMEPPTSQVAILQKISSIVASERSLEEMLGEIIGLTVQVTDCDACLVYLFDRDTNEIVLQASQVPHASEIGNLRLKVGEGVTGWVAEHKSAVVLSSLSFDDARFKRFPVLVEDTYEAFLSVPLVSSGELIGVINVHHREIHEHTKDEISLVSFMGEQMGTAIGRAKLVEENARLSRLLEERKVIERAKGILQRRHNLSEEESYLQLRNESRRLRRPMKELAEAIIFAEELNKRASLADPSLK